MTSSSLPLLQGTLDLLILRVLSAGPLHGYGIAPRIHDSSNGALVVEDAALYQALHSFFLPRWSPATCGRAVCRRRRALGAD